MALLDLSTESNAPTVKIDGREYALTDFDGLSLLDQHYMKSKATRVAGVFDKETLSEGDEDALGSIVDDLFGKIAGQIPEAVQEKLRFGARLRIIEAYFLEFRGATPEAEASSQIQPVSSSPGSNDSTAATPPDGSISPPGSSSGS